MTFSRQYRFPPDHDEPFDCLELLRGWRLLMIGIVLAVLAWAIAARGAESTDVVKAARTDLAPVIDGLLNDAAWSDGEWMSRFTQREPDEMAPPTQKTDVKIVFDDEALYIGAMMHDTAPDSIDVRLVRRDNDIETDFIAVYLDPYHDHRSGYYFGINSAGTLLDGTRYNDTWADASWDGVWEGASKLLPDGWSAEFRLPFSQLRFAKHNPMIWGVNFKRWIGRRNEVDQLSVVPKNENAFVSRFWHLEGLTGIKQPRYFEILPYLRGKAEFQPVAEGDPFNQSGEYAPSAGADLKLGLGPNVVLNATVNPDFGQVEVDPAVVNLSDVETYFNEKRPFFVEGSSIFDFGYGGATNYWSSNWPAPKFFYSRRIGRAPQSVPDNDFSEVPEGTHILGAGKLTAKFPGNWNVGSMHAFTMREHADIEYDGVRSETEVEPFTYYSVTRGQKEIREGYRGIGGIFTSAHRFFDDRRLIDDINSDAFTGGFDGWSFLDKNRTYALTGWMGFSHLRGTPDRMIAVQRSSRHYFQRPDASHLRVDSSATTLTGWAGRILLSKEKGNWMLNSAIGVISPEFDLNDVGYSSRADLTNTHLGGGYSWTKPTAWTRYADISAMQWINFDFEGNNTALGTWLGTSLQLRNYWWLNLSVAGVPETINNTRTRGGPLTKNRGGWETNFSSNSDSRKPVVFSFGSNRYTVAPDHWTHYLWCSAQWKPAGNLSVTLSPDINLLRLWVQWVDCFDDPVATATSGKRYIFSAIDQTETSASLRVDYTLTPKLSVQLYAQQLYSAADYFDFRELSEPNSFKFYTYPPSGVQYDLRAKTYTIDPDGDGPAEALTFDDPDFNYTSLRGNAVVRWEYRPGSTLFLVWTHGQDYSETRGDFGLNRSANRLFSGKADNIFMLKATFWLAG